MLRHECCRVKHLLLLLRLLLWNMVAFGAQEAHRRSLLMIDSHFLVSAMLLLLLLYLPGVACVCSVLLKGMLLLTTEHLLLWMFGEGVHLPRGELRPILLILR